MLRKNIKQRFFLNFTACSDILPPRNARIECVENTESDIVECVSICLDGYSVSFNAKNTVRCGPSTNFEWAYREGQWLPDCMGRFRYFPQCFQTALNHKQ